MESESKANILLVDDRPENLLALQAILEDLGQNLICAASGQEALRFLLTEDVALVLLDVQMPELNGFEFAELIRERERTQHTPIIFVSATSSDEQYIFKGYSLGAVDYMTKPFEPEILKSKVRFFTKLFLQNQEIKRQAELLEQTNGKLDRLNAELEARVERRTSQLEEANRDLEKEIAVRKQSEARLATEHAITRTLADAVSLESAAKTLLQAFCEHMQADVCSLWLPAEAETELFCAQIETLSEIDEFAVFINESRRINLACGIGLPGHVWKKNAAVWLPNTVKGEKFPRATIAATVGLHSAIGFPIKINKEFYGVIEFFTRRKLMADQYLLNSLEAIGSEVGQFIQRKRAEAERENLLQREKFLREKAETANRLKDEFLATVSHELRTPLNAIIGWGHILQAGKLSPEKQKDALDTIFRNAKSQVQLINDLLDTSRLITGNLLLNLSPTPLIPVIEDALDAVRPAAEAKGITFSTGYDNDAETIICDSQRLQQVIWNLLTNAVKFTPANGEVSVDLRQNDGKIQISVSDTGEGIEPEFLPYVFERFRQADSSSTRKHNGLGLGLAIVRHLTELHGGSVEATSEGQGKGATFTITLPITLAANAQIKSSGEAHNGNDRHKIENLDLVGVRILIVDDDADTCEMLTYALNLLGAEARAVNSVFDAFVSMSDWNPDVLLSDINMPDEDGYSFIRKIRDSAPEKCADVPAIALTALARPEDGEQALSSGFQLHLAKPVNMEQLIEAIAGLTGKSSGS